MAKKVEDAEREVQWPSEYVRPRDAVRILGNMVNADIPVIFMGPPGVGKTDISRQMVGYMKKPDGSPRFSHALIINISYRKPTFVGGLPVVEEQEIKVGGKKVTAHVAKYVPPDLIPVGDQDQDVLLVWDDISSCSTTLQSAFLEVLHEKMLGSYPLPKGSYQIGTANRAGDHNGAFDLNAAMASRCALVGVRPDAEDLRAYALKSGWDQRVSSFIAFRPYLTFRFDPIKDAGRNYPTPRTWDHVARTIKAGWDPGTDTLALPTASALIGSGTAAEFIAFCKTYGQLPDVEEVFRGKNPKSPVDPASKYAWAGACAAYAAASDDPVGFGARLAGYSMKCMEDEFAVLALRDFLTSPAASTRQVIDRIQQRKEIEEFCDKFGNVLVV